jgi:hypothetical protein
VGLNTQKFRDEFAYLVRDEPPPLVFDLPSEDPSARVPH